MLYFGDSERVLEPRSVLLRLSSRLTRSDAAVDADRLLASLIDLAEVVQGVLDHDLLTFAEEQPPRARAELLRATHRLAGAYCAVQGGRPAIVAAEAERVQRLADVPLPPRVRARVSEGLAHYAVYPELYAAAARRFAGAGPVRVLGIRTAGVLLGAVVAAEIDAPPPYTIRPEGHPFERKLRISRALRDELGRQSACEWLIVDEGPGLSGSSFLTAARLLEECGVPAARIHLLPSHAGPPGAASNREALQSWARYGKSHVGFEEHFQELPFVVRRAPASRWPAPSFMNLSSGRWRELCFERARFPPAARARERRKYWFVEDGVAKLAKFAGLGAHGARKLGRARLLAGRGFIPPVTGARRGFLVSDWLEGPPAAVFAQDRRACLSTLGRYLALLTKLTAAPGDRGAPPSGLLEMAEHNIEQCLGREAAREAAGLRASARALDASALAVYVDGKLEPWEWLSVGGRVFKTDALDHAVSHDLVRAQDIEWDVAGAWVELELDDRELDQLTTVLAGSSRYRPDSRRLLFYGLCYLAFRAGALALAGDSEPDADERRRLHARRDWYAARLAATLGRV